MESGLVNTVNKQTSDVIVCYVISAFPVQNN
jgi:hypothetical protein